MSLKENEFLEQIVIEMHDLLINFAKLKLTDHHSAYDVVQETYLAAQKNIGKLMMSANPQGWMMETLKYKVLHEYRAKSRFYMLTKKITSTNNATICHEDNYDFDIKELINKDEYIVLNKLYIEGYSIKEIADIQGISYEACKKRIHAAKRKLAKELM